MASGPPIPGGLTCLFVSNYSVHPLAGPPRGHSALSCRCNEVSFSSPRQGDRRLACNTHPVDSDRERMGIPRVAGSGVVTWVWMLTCCASAHENHCVRES